MPFALLQEIQEMRNRQQQKQVLDKPNLHPEPKKSTSSKKPVVAVRDPDDFEDPAAADVVQPKSGGSGGGSGVGASGQGPSSYDVRVHESAYFLDPLYRVGHHVMDLGWVVCMFHGSTLFLG